MAQTPCFKSTLDRVVTRAKHHSNAFHMRLHGLLDASICVVMEFDTVDEIIPIPKIFAPTYENADIFHLLQTRDFNLQPLSLS